MGCLSSEEAAFCMWIVNTAEYEIDRERGKRERGREGEEMRGEDREASGERESLHNNYTKKG